MTYLYDVINIGVPQVESLADNESYLYVEDCVEKLKVSIHTIINQHVEEIKEHTPTVVVSKLIQVCSDSKLIKHFTGRVHEYLITNIIKSVRSNYRF